MGICTSKQNETPSIPNEKAEACDQDGDDPIEGCVKLKRLIALLTRYSQLDIEKNTDDKEAFIALFGGDYTQLNANELFGKCDVTKCHFTARHQTRESTNTKVMTDHRVNFYSQLLDSFHFYLMHLFECGMRTETNDIDQKGDEDEQMDDDNQYFDARFARISRAINQRQHIRLAFARFKTNNKFNIQAATATGGSSNTVYMDEAVRCLLYSNAHEETIRNFAEFFAFHQYDSESMKEDIRHASQGNIAVNIGDEEVVKALDEFIQAAELRSSSFNIGLTFYYWPEYEKMDAFDANTNKFNLNDHGGYEVRDLFVKRRHVSFKEEIMAYAFVSMAKYEVIMTKVKEYLKTNSVKQIKAYNESGHMNWNIVLKYGIPHGSVLFSRHLLALFLYTDCTDLCTHFSATFRANKQYEALGVVV